MADLLDFTAAADLANGLAVMAVKGLVILFVVTLICIALKNAPASLKHLCWGIGLGAVLILPFLSLMVPDWNVGLIERPLESPAPEVWVPNGAAHASVAAENAADNATEKAASASTIAGSTSLAGAEATRAGGAEATRAGDGEATGIGGGEAAQVGGSPAPAVAGGVAASSSAGGAYVSGHRAAQRADAATAVVGTPEARGAEVRASWFDRRPTAAWILGIWVLGAAAVLLHMLFSSLSVRRIVARARPVTDRAWLDTLEEIGDRLFIRRPVQLLESSRISVPVAWGAVRPVILIPANADTWSEERRRCVLAHELAHVRRWDMLTQSAARLACAIHWFNPLAWKAAGAMQLEREKACDDYVLTASRARASEYATHLLDIARRVPGSLAPPAGAIAMARRSQLEGRVLAILDEGRRRSLAPLPVAATVIIMFLIVVPIAAMSPFAAQPADNAGIAGSEEIGSTEAAISHAAVTIKANQPRSTPVPIAESKEWKATAVSEENVARSSQDTIERTFNVADGGLLVIDADYGNVQLNTGKSGQVHVSVRRMPRGQASAEEYEVTFRQEGDRITIIGTNTIRQSGRAGVSVDFVVTVPDRYNVDAETAGGNIAVDNLDGRVKLNTSGGNLSLGRISGQVDAHTSGGNISLDGSNADVVVNTSGGNISLGRVRGTVRATTSGGNISVDEVNGHIVAKTSGGQISAKIATQPEADCVLRTSGGSISVYLADDIGVDLEAETSAGHVSTDVEVAIEGRIKEDRIHGKINGGGPLLELDTSAGDIRIMRM